MQSRQVAEEGEGKGDDAKSDDRLCMIRFFESDSEGGGTYTYFIAIEEECNVKSKLRPLIFYHPYIYIGFQ